MRTRFERFCFRHRDKGIPNLMLYICIISAVIYLSSLIRGGAVIYQWLCFDKIKILQGQVWRLFTFIFTYTPGTNAFLILIGFYFFYHLSRHVELIMGTFKFNLFYFSGMLLMVVFAMIFAPVDPVAVEGGFLPAELVGAYVYGNMAWYMHLTLLLIFAVTNPDSQFLIFFVVPVKAWFLSILYLVLLVIDMCNMSDLFPHNLFPLIGIANFLLFAGKDVLNLLPEPIRPSGHRRPRQQRPTGTISFDKGKEKGKPTYLHRCAVCGRTDVTDPQLEFRYCSRCNGYFCYCEDHINNHAHVE